MGRWKSFSSDTPAFHSPVSNQWLPVWKSHRTLYWPTDCVLAHLLIFPLIQLQPLTSRADFNAVSPTKLLIIFFCQISIYVEITANSVLNLNGLYVLQNPVFVHKGFSRALKSSVYFSKIAHTVVNLALKKVWHSLHLSQSRSPNSSCQSNSANLRDQAMSTKFLNISSKTFWSCCALNFYSPGLHFALFSTSLFCCFNSWNQCLEDFQLWQSSITTYFNEVRFMKSLLLLLWHFKLFAIQDKLVVFKQAVPSTGDTWRKWNVSISVGDLIKFLQSLHPKCSYSFGFPAHLTSDTASLMQTFQYSQ